MTYCAKNTSLDEFESAMMQVEKRIAGIRLLTLLLIANITALLWTTSSAAFANDKLNVVTSIIPQKYFVKKIGGDLVHVSSMVLPGSSPATYEPKPQQMVGLTRSEIYFAIGVPFEKVWLKKFAHVNDKMMIVHTEDGIEKIPMTAHSHHDEKDHYHGVEDPHIWLSPPLVMIQARNIYNALITVDPGDEEIYKANYRVFMEEIADLDGRIKDVFSKKGEGIQFMVYHPAWGYFAKAYGLEQIPVEIEGKEPTAKELQNLINHAGNKGIKVIFVQPQLSSKCAHTIAEAIGCRVVMADPLAEDWSRNLLDVAEKFGAALK